MAIAANGPEHAESRNMAVRCSKCGEELLGAVNRCWKCGQAFAARPELDGSPPVRQGARLSAAEEPLEAVVLDDADEAARALVAGPKGSGVFFGQRPTTIEAAVPKKTPDPVGGAAQPQMPLAGLATAVRQAQPAAVSTADRIDAQRQGLMAMGGTVGSLVLACFALAIAPFRFEAALIALIGLAMGIWGLYSPRRRLAFAAMMLCCLAIGLGAYTGVRQLHIHIMKTRQPVIIEDGGAP
jgi:hypothetical protein